MLSCKEVVKIISTDDNQGWKKKLSVRMHLLFCHHCRKYAKQLEYLNIGVKKLLSTKSESIDEKKIRELEEKIYSKVKPKT